MTKTLRIVASGFVLMWLMGCTAGNVEFREAQKAELRKDWDTALVDYEKARPGATGECQDYHSHKVGSCSGHGTALKQGEQLLKEGRTDEAAAELQKAVSIDPTNEAAAMELARVVAAQAAARKARESALKEALKSTAGGGKHARDQAETVS